MIPANMGFSYKKRPSQMKIFVSAKMIGILMLIFLNAIQAQTGTQPEKLIKALNANNLTDALEIAGNIDSVNYRDRSGLSLLMYASEIGYTELCKKLIDKGADLNLQSNNGLTALLLASQNGHVGVVKLLLDKRADPDLQEIVFNTTALMQASQNGYTEVVRLLLDKGAE
jgi:serine/threonine-protein phosphatase 6 regulatory ankyrin repeat subunit B